MKLKNILMAVAGGVGAIAVFLPWFSASILGFSVSANGLEDIFGILSLIVAIGIVVWNLLIMFKVVKIAEKTGRIIDTCLGGALALFGVIALIRNLGEGEGLVSPSIGVFLTIAAGIAVAIVAWLKLDEKAKKTPKAK